MDATERERRFSGDRVSARELARRVNRSRNQLADIVAGRQLPDYATLDDLIQTLRLDPAEAIGAWLEDQAAQAGRPARSVSVGTPLDAARLLQARHHDIRIGRITQSGVADLEGNVDLKLTYAGCQPGPQADLNRLRLWIRAAGTASTERPSIRIQAPPKLKWQIATDEANPGQYAVEFPRGWRDGTVDVELDTHLPGAYRVDEPALVAAAEESETGEAPGDFRYRLSMFVEELELSFRFPTPLQPSRWWAVAGPVGCRPGDDSHSVLEDVCESAELTPTLDGSSARLLLKRPLSGYRFGLNWSVRPSAALHGARDRQERQQAK